MSNVQCRDYVPWRPRRVPLSHCVSIGPPPPCPIVPCPPSACFAYLRPSERRANETGAHAETACWGPRYPPPTYLKIARITKNSPKSPRAGLPMEARRERETHTHAQIAQLASHVQRGHCRKLFTCDYKGFMVSPAWVCCLRCMSCSEMGHPAVSPHSCVAAWKGTLHRQVSAWITFGHLHSRSNANRVSAAIPT